MINASFQVTTSLPYEFGPVRAKLAFPHSRSWNKRQYLAFITGRCLFEQNTAWWLEKRKKYRPRLKQQNLRALSSSPLGSCDLSRDAGGHKRRIPWTCRTKILKLKDTCSLDEKLMTNLDSILKSRAITLPTKVHLVKAMVLPVII